MVINAEFSADIAADVVMAPELDIFADFFSSQADCIKAEVIDFCLREPVLLQLLDEFGMGGFKRKACRIHKLVFILNQFVAPCPVGLCVG